MPFSYSGTAATINPNDADIIWNATASRWEISFPVTGFSGFFVKTKLFTLPLGLVSFAAEEKNCITTLKWITKDEINVSRFEAEQSKDGVSFNMIKTVPARNTGSENNYAVAFPVMNERMFYRLKMVDIDGTVTYSETVRVSSRCAGKEFVYPNPAKDRIYLSNATVGNRYTIYNTTGQRVRSGLINNVLQEINITGWAPGIYYIDMNEGEKWKFVKE